MCGGGLIVPFVLSEQSKEVHAIFALALNYAKLPPVIVCHFPPALASVRFHYISVNERPSHHCYQLKWNVNAAYVFVCLCEAGG